MKRANPARIVRFAAVVCVGATALLASSCSTPDPTPPAGVGPLTSVGRSPEGLVLKIESDQATGRIREPLRFTATIQNMGAQDVRIPVAPVLQYIWIYPNRQKDHYLVEVPRTCHYQTDATRILRPGETMSVVNQIDTQWFPFAGVTEFQAIWILPENTNPGLDGFPKGPIHSNRFGVQMKIR